MSKKYILFSVTFGIVLVLDQMTKIYISSILSMHESFPVIAGLFNITYTRNPGAAFGFLAGAPPVFRSVFFFAVAIVAIALVLYLIRKAKDSELLLTFSLTLVLSGAVGNLIDRVRLGEVIDFLDVYIASYHWPAFNVADSAISIGAIILVLEMLKRKREVNR